MPSIRIGRPTEPDAAAIRDELADVLIHLIEAGCAYVAEHPDAKDEIGRAAGDSFLASGLGRADERDEAES
jgi:hypothetical protein